MATFARPRTLQGHGKFIWRQFPKTRQHRPASCFVKIGGQKETGFIQKHWIDAHNEITAMIITLQMHRTASSVTGRKRWWGIRNI